MADVKYLYQNDKFDTVMPNQQKKETKTLTNLDYVRQLPAEELAKLLVRDNVFMDIEDNYCDEYYFKNDPLNRTFMDEEDAAYVCAEWLNSDCGKN